ncbi:MAG: helix-turn-helix domain-containing protein [Candidatus Gastranaerophilales bacterium]|nr:helix-turn-helix domain-containing protein [Candidatus Gastranaerophilales bacterium]
MLIGERIKRIRTFREMTQKELGIAMGFPDGSASVRIAQYENCVKVPKKATADDLARILNCNPKNFYSDSDLKGASYIMMDLFWLEESVGETMYIFQLEKYNDRDDPRIVHGKFNDYNFVGGYPPVALAFNYNLINDFMREWATRYSELKKKEITWQEYFEWKINWPATCDDGGRFEPSYQWRKESQHP